VVGHGWGAQLRQNFAAPGLMRSIVFAAWGLALHEWRGSSRRTMSLVLLGLFVLVASTIIVGYGNYLGGKTGTH
jgi:hypothetical protein